LEKSLQGKLYFNKVNFVNKHASKNLKIKNTMETIIKKRYTSPVVERIKLDNDISLQLESEPPFGPGETGSLTPEYIKNDPYKTTGC